MLLLKLQRRPAGSPSLLSPTFLGGKILPSSPPLAIRPTRGEDLAGLLKCELECRSEQNGASTFTVDHRLELALDFYCSIIVETFHSMSTLIFIFTREYLLSQRVLLLQW